MARRGAIACGLFAVIVVIAGILAGCSWFGAPATTEELLVRYATNENASNYTANTQIDLNVSALGIHAKLPIKVSIKTVDGSAHGFLTVDLSSLKVDDYTMEYYAELQDKRIMCYLGAPSFDRSKITWKRWQVDTTSNIDLTILIDLLRESELTTIAKSSDERVSYELAIPTKAVLQTAFKLSEAPVVIAGMDEQSLLDAVGNGKVRFYFTKDCLFRSTNTSVSATAKNAATNNIAVQAGVDFSMVFDDYGNTDPAELVVPDAIKQSAVLVDEPINVLDVIGPDSPFAKAVPQ